MDGGFASTIRIKNSLVVGPITVSPVLYMEDGTAYPLPSVLLATAGIATVNINQALAEAPPPIIAHRSLFGSAALYYRYHMGGVVLADLVAIDVGRSLIFPGPFNEAGDEPPAHHTAEGMWWRHDPDVGGSVALANTTDQALQATVQVFGSRGTRQPEETVDLAPRATTLLDLDRLTAGLPGLENQAGGVRVQYTGRLGAVMVAGGLENDREGYSAGMPFYFFHDLGPARPEFLTYAGVGMLVGSPDPGLGFPEETHFTPYAVVRNSTARPRLIVPKVYRMVGDRAVVRLLLPQVLRPYETRQLDMPRLLAAAGLRDYNGRLTLSFSFAGQHGDVIFAAGSVDQTGTYVFETNPEGVGPSLSKQVPRWTVAGGFDTLFPVWNPTAAPQDLLLVISYADGTRTYELPFHLGPFGFRSIDIAQVIAARQPDPHGNVIPAWAQEGSAMIESARGMTKRINVRIDAATFNVETATCGGCCYQCDGYYSMYCTPSPAYCPPSKTAQISAMAYYTTGKLMNLTTISSWSSGNTSIATVETQGQSSPGLATGLTAGTADITAFAQVTVSKRICNCMACPLGESAFCPMTVQVPAYVSALTPITGSLLCSGSNFMARYLHIKYQVLDSTESPINFAGMTIAEQLSWTSGVCATSNACGQKPTPGTWITDETGSMTLPDEIVNCSSTCTHGGSCSEDWQQTFTVDGAAVGIVNGSVTGTLNCITTGCSTSPNGTTQ